MRLWNLSGRQVNQFEFSENVIDLAFSLEGKKIAVADSNGQIWLISVENLEELLDKSCKFLLERPNYFMRVGEFCHKSMD